eukprot:5440105-Ditylum_brightwellii.AAC.1
MLTVGKKTDDEGISDTRRNLNFELSVNLNCSEINSAKNSSSKVVETMTRKGTKAREERKRILMETNKASEEKGASDAERKRKGAGYSASQKEAPLCKKQKKTNKKRVSKGNDAEKVYNDGTSRPSYINAVS